MKSAEKKKGGFSLDRTLQQSSSDVPIGTENPLHNDEKGIADNSTGRQFSLDRSLQISYQDINAYGEKINTVTDSMEAPLLNHVSSSERSSTRNVSRNQPTSSQRGLQRYLSEYDIATAAAQKKISRQIPLMVLEIFNSGNTGKVRYKDMNLSQLLKYVNDEAARIDSNVNPSHENNCETEQQYTIGSSLLGVSTVQSEINSNIKKNLSGKKLHELSQEDRIVHSHLQQAYLQQRDLRRLEYKYNPVGEPTILVRRHCCIISFEPLRAIVQANRILLLGTDVPNSVLKILEDYITTPENQALDMPFEERAFEAICSTTLAILNHEYEQVKMQVEWILEDFRTFTILSVEVQEQLRVIKNKMSQFISQAGLYKKALNDILDDDELMALMNLTKLKEKPSLYTVPLQNEILRYHCNIEVLFDSYIVDYTALESKFNFLQAEVQSAEESLLLRLDTSRNQLLTANTVIAVLTCTLGFGSFVGSLYGMNLVNHFEEDPIAWYIVVVSLFVIIIVTSICSVRYFILTGVLPKTAGYYSKNGVHDGSKMIPRTFMSPFQRTPEGIQNASGVYVVVKDQ